MTKAAHDHPTTLPADLPVPTDDGGAWHLRPGTHLPHLSLPCTSGESCDIASLGVTPRVFFFLSVHGRARPTSQTWFCGANRGSWTPADAWLHSPVVRLPRPLQGVPTPGRQHHGRQHQHHRSPTRVQTPRACPLRVPERLFTPPRKRSTSPPSISLSSRAARTRSSNAWRGTASMAKIRKVWYPVFPPDQ